jgi:hypothetical protein
MQEQIAAIVTCVLILALCVAAYFAYFLPTIIASKRQHRNLASISLVNIFLGWTFIGWFVALLWAIHND